MEFGLKVKPYDIKFLKVKAALMVKDHTYVKVDHKLILQLFIND